MHVMDGLPDLPRLRRGIPHAPPSMACEVMSGTVSHKDMDAYEIAILTGTVNNRIFVS